MAKNNHTIENIAELKEIDFSSIDGWEKEDHLAALSCFKVSAKRMVEKAYSTKKLGVDAFGLAKIAKQALSKDLPTNSHAKLFFETKFQPCTIDPIASEGFITGYFEPEIKASLKPTSKFKFPILRRPDDLVNIDDKSRPNGMDSSYFFAKRSNNGLIEYDDRAAIENGSLDDKGLELFWFESRIDIFFIHIQGSARLILDDGSVRRISYAAKTGQPFTPIGKRLIEMGELTLENVTMGSIREWLETHPDKAGTLMQENRSYIFFQEIDHPVPELGPVAAAGVPLTPGRSLAIDHRLQTFGAPIFVNTQKPLPGSSENFSRLMISQDTGSAIVGPARGDLFIGTGKEAGEIAGGIKHSAEFIVFLPKAVPIVTAE